MKSASQFVLRAIASLAILCGLAILNVAAANGPPSYQLRCVPVSTGVDQIICQNQALRAAYKTAARALEEKRIFYFMNEVGNGFPRVSAEFERARRKWPSACGVDRKVKPRTVVSGQPISCLIDMLWGANFDARCPLIISLVGTPSAEQQHAWFKRNEAFCMEEARYYFGDSD